MAAAEREKLQVREGARGAFKPRRQGKRRNYPLACSDACVRLLVGRQGVRCGFQTLVMKDR